MRQKKSTFLSLIITSNDVSLDNHESFLPTYYYDESLLPTVPTYYDHRGRGARDDAGPFGGIVRGEPHGH